MRILERYLRSGANFCSVKIKSKSKGASFIINSGKARSKDLANILTKD